MEAWVEVARTDGTSERHRIEGDQVTLGRSPAAGIPLVNCEELMAEHMLLAPRPDGCWVAVAEGAVPGAKVRGQPFQAGVVPWGTELAVGGITLRITDKLGPVKKVKGGDQVGSPILIVAFILLPLAGWMLLSDPEVELSSGPEGEPPALFTDVSACPEQGAGALLRATEAAEAASHKAERYPFDAQDGVSAVDLYATASACYRAADRGPDADRVTRERSALGRRIDEDYRTHRLRLERALEAEDYPDALIQARALAALLGHNASDPYALWLDDLVRQLQLFADQSLSNEDG